MVRLPTRTTDDPYLMQCPCRKDNRVLFNRLRPCSNTMREGERSRKSSYFGRHALTGHSLCKHERVRRQNSTCSSFSTPSAKPRTASSTSSSFSSATARSGCRLSFASVRGNASRSTSPRSRPRTQAPTGDGRCCDLISDFNPGCAKR
jgi:hypothetical protein